MHCEIIKNGIIYQRDHVFGYAGWPTVAKLKDGTLACVYSGDRLAHVCPFGKVLLSKSFDDGETWGAPTTVINSVLDDRDGGICTFGEDGVVVTSFNNHPEFQRKHQGDSLYRKAYLDEVEKREFEKYLGSTIVISRDGGKTFGDVMTVPVSSPHGPCVLSDGTLLYVGRTFDAYNMPSRLECHVLTPDGKTQLRSVIEEPIPTLTWCEPHAIQLPDGKIIVHIRVQGQNGKYFTIYQSVSTDMGYTFSTPIRLLSDHGGAKLLLEKDSSGQLLLEETLAILADGNRREAMAAAMADLGIPDANQRIYDTVMALLK